MTSGSDDPYTVAQFEAPAFVRRALAAEAAWEAVLERCRLKRNELLPIVRMRLGRLGAMAGDWAILGPLLADPRDVARLEVLFKEWQPRLRIAVQRVKSPRQLIVPLRELAESCRRFNRRFVRFVAELDLSRLNALRDGYNRHYVLEKECATRSPQLARQGFRPLAPISHADLLARFPPLPEFELSLGTRESRSRGEPA